MSYELVSRTLAYVSCMFVMSLFTTSMALAAIQAGLLAPLHGPPVLTAQAVKAKAVTGGWTIRDGEMANAETAKKI